MEPIVPARRLRAIFRSRRRVATRGVEERQADARKLDRHGRGAVNGAGGNQGHFPVLDCRSVVSAVCQAEANPRQGRGAAPERFARCIVSVLVAAGNCSLFEETAELEPGLRERVVVHHQVLRVARPMPASAASGGFLYFVGDLNSLEEPDEARVLLVMSGILCGHHRRVADRQT